ncbi:hypothetical protein [Paenibacillus apis]|uniref:ABC transporter domain-containing protein n=1 Tax=Paenibacillus apis TaxID=1792174 RepID=A0A920CI98_9BACL|nr:hypothetical protein [Paenibacillus apis]GIO41366.1 hypothetical protein J41TS4_11240 [Paenibacillus apis]
MIPGPSGSSKSTLLNLLGGWIRRYDYPRYQAHELSHCGQFDTIVLVDRKNNDERQAKEDRHGVFFEIRGLKGGFTDGLHIELGDYAIDKRGSSKNCS